MDQGRLGRGAQRGGRDTGDNLPLWQELPRILLGFQQGWLYTDEAPPELRTVAPYPLTIEAKGKLTDAYYRIEKMKVSKKKDPESGKNMNDRSTVIYNARITLKDTPKAPGIMWSTARLGWIG